MNDSERVVFDCNVYFQALISPGGPAGEAFKAAKDRRLTLYVSATVLSELSDVCSRPHLVEKFHLSEQRLNTFLRDVVANAQFLDHVPHVFDYERDPDDAHYIDLAVAADAKLIVSRDKDLLALRDTTTADHKRLQKIAPGIEILTPVELIIRL